jgi:peptidoglycan/LPS O-acetylase OafA/YrhL/lysophospholipase L1-like esterase
MTFEAGSVRQKAAAETTSTTSTIGKILGDHRGHGPGFDALRIYLSISVLCWHSIAICYGSTMVLRVWNAPYGRPFITILPMFFALSGFLVMGSAIRLGSLRHFLANRFLRIFPALATEVTISALILGPLVTVLPLSDYFTSPTLFTYFGSLIGRVQFVLPGVFLNNPLPGVVNGNLWTIPPEILCYLFMAVMIVMALFRERVPVTIAAAGVLLLNLLQDHAEGWGLPEGLLPVRYLVLCFAFGTVLFMWRDMLPYRWPLFAFAAAVGLIFLQTPGLIDVSLFALAYCTAFLGVTPLPKGRLFAGGDYSYGVYLFGAPIQQTIASVFPATHHIYWNIPLSLTLTIGVAALSWHLVEKHALALRQFVSNSDGILRRSFALRAVVSAAIIAYAMALIRISNIRFTEPLDAWTIAAALVVITAGALIAAVVPTLRTVKRPFSATAFASACALCLAFGAIAGRIVHRPQHPTVILPLVDYAAGRANVMRAFPTRARIVMFGDSITEWVNWNALLGNADIGNRGIAGDTTANALARVDTVLAAKPERVFIMLGINDIAIGAPVPDIIDRYRAIVRAIFAGGARVIVQSTLPKAQDDEANGQVALLNQQLRAMCETEPCHYLDLTSAMAPLGRLPADMTIDGIHLNAAGYRAWATVLAPYLADERP